MKSGTFLIKKWGDVLLFHKQEVFPWVIGFSVILMLLAFFQNCGDSLMMNSTDSNSSLCVGLECSLTLNEADTSVPIITITLPADMTNTIVSNIPLSGTVSDNIGVASVTWTNSANAASGTALIQANEQVGTYTWSIENISLVTGSNNITISARDVANNYSTNTLTITRQITNTSSQWLQVPIRSSLQKNLGLSGGEGWQAVQDIKYAPSNPSIVYLVVDTSGVWKSVDGGNSWKIKSKGFSTIGGQSMSVHPNNPNIVFVAGSNMAVSATTPESQIAGALQGIFRTKNGGESWTLVKQAAIYRDRRSKGASMFAFSGTNTVYAGTHYSGLLKSTDGGDTWATIVPQTTLMGGVAMGGIYDIETHPTNSSILYMTTSAGLVKVTSGNSVTTTKIGGGLPRSPYQVEINKNNPLIIYVSVGVGGVYKSTDGGVHFNPSNNGLNLVNQAYDLTISPADPNYLYVTYMDSNLTDLNYGFFFSHNGGVSWQVPTTMDEDGIIESLMGSFYKNIKGHSYSTPVAAHPTNREIAITNFQPEELITTINGGDTWKYSSTGYTGAATGIMSAAPIAWDKTNQNRWFMGFHDFGAVLTENKGDTFRKIPSGSNAFVGVLEKNLMVTVTGSWDTQMVTVSRDGGNSFTKVIGTDNKYKSMFLHPQNSNILYAQKFKFTNIQSSNTFTTLSKSVWAIYPKNGNIVYSIGKDVSNNFIVYKSTNGGLNWITPYPPLLGSSGGWVSQMAVDPNNENRLYVLVPSIGIYVITGIVANGGLAVLKNEANGIYKDQFGMIRPIAVVVDPRSSNVVYVGMFSPLGKSSGVFRSIDYGNNWTNITRDYFGTHLNIDSLIVSPWDSYLYLGSMMGNWKFPPP